jgi:hypothetical protein
MPATLLPASLLNLDFTAKEPPSLMEQQGRAGLTPSLREFTVSAALASEDEARMLAMAHPARRAAPRQRLAVLRLTQISASLTPDRIPYEYLASVCLDWALSYRR